MSDPVGTSLFPLTIIYPNGEIREGNGDIENELVLAFDPSKDIKDLIRLSGVNKRTYALLSNDNFFVIFQRQHPYLYFPKNSEADLFRCIFLGKSARETQFGCFRQYHPTSCWKALCWLTPMREHAVKGWVDEGYLPEEDQYVPPVQVELKKPFPQCAWKTEALVLFEEMKISAQKNRSIYELRIHDITHSRFEASDSPIHRAWLAFASVQNLLTYAKAQDPIDQETLEFLEHRSGVLYKKYNDLEWDRNFYQTKVDRVNYSFDDYLDKKIYGKSQEKVWKKFVNIRLELSNEFKCLYKIISLSLKETISELEKNVKSIENLKNKKVEDFNEKDRAEVIKLMESIRPNQIYQEIRGKFPHFFNTSTEISIIHRDLDLICEFIYSKSNDYKKYEQNICMFNQHNKRNNNYCFFLMKWHDIFTEEFRELDWDKFDPSTQALDEFMNESGSDDPW